MGQRWLNEWILGRVSGIPGRFCRGGYHHQLGKGERAWYRDHRTLSLIFNYYLFTRLWLEQQSMRLKSEAWIRPKSPVRRERILLDHQASQLIGFTPWDCFLVIFFLFSTTEWKKNALYDVGYPLLYSILITLPVLPFLCFMIPTKEALEQQVSYMSKSRVRDWKGSTNGPWKLLSTTFLSL